MVEYPCLQTSIGENDKTAYAQLLSFRFEHLGWDFVALDSNRRIGIRDRIFRKVSYWIGHDFVGPNLVRSNPIDQLFGPIFPAQFLCPPRNHATSLIIHQSLH